MHHLIHGNTLIIGWHTFSLTIISKDLWICHGLCPIFESEGTTDLFTFACTEHFYSSSCMTDQHNRGREFLRTACKKAECPITNEPH
jgi:hypothetical protein